MTAIKTRESSADSSGPEPRSELPRLGWRGGLRYLWTQLTSMRTALILLFALALAAIPGSLVPRNPKSTPIATPMSTKTRLM